MTLLRYAHQKENRKYQFASRIKKGIGVGFNTSHGNATRNICSLNPDPGKGVQRPAHADRKKKHIERIRQLRSGVVLIGGASDSAVEYGEKHHVEHHAKDPIDPLGRDVPDTEDDSIFSVRRDAAHRPQAIIMELKLMANMVTRLFACA
eukprot:CAMPEP_0179418010 /NCGR_PEP_ID=MMETSP0799-20121207/7710_1 /TAXON_ID=46947 /ORGANISM="Geminigera cryophila, Strain CCMP2564" /LENGTH=148 /DNA_ID=CAMNT_0021191133 /DNA_START=77 /DNA_END=520 /DNA_ORIENTATION=+